MKNKVLKYRFILLNISITLVFISSFNLNNYILMVYFIPNRTIELVFTLMLILVNGYFLIDNIYYYVKMYNEIIIRINKNDYFVLLLKKILYCYALLLVSQLILNYLACGDLLLMLTFSYFIVFISTFFMLNRFLKNIPQDILIIVFSFCIFFLKCMYLLFFK